MAIFDVETESNKDLIQLYSKLNYITDFCATNQELIYGSAVSIINPYEEMEAVKIMFDQTERGAFRHYVLSIEEHERISLVCFKSCAIEVCELISNFYGSYQVLMAVHVNTDNLHIHYVANSIDYTTGKRFDLNLQRLRELKNKINEILCRYNLLPIRIKNQ